MPVALIFSQSTSDAARLVSHLQALGYTTEVVPPDASGIESQADLEIRLDQCSRADALAEAERRARELGADIYIAGGALQLTETVQGSVEPEYNAGGALQLTEPVQGSVEPEPWVDPFPQDQAVTSSDAESFTVRDPLSPVLIAIPAISEIAESYPARTEGAPPLASGEFDERETGGPAQPIQAPIAAEAAPGERDTFAGFTLFGEANIAEETPSPTADRWTTRLTKPAAILRETAGQLTKNVFAVFASGGRQAMERLRAGRQPHSPQASEVASAPVAAHAAQPEVASPPSVSPIISPPPSRAGRPLPWVAFASAGAVVVAALLGWSVLAGSSATPNVPINGSIEQQVPFGAVKIVPRTRPSQLQAPRKPAPAPPAHPVTAATTAKSSAHGRVSAKPKTTTRHVAHGVHRAREQAAENEVIVHHYAAPKPPTQAKVTNTGVKHISDQE